MRRSLLLLLMLGVMQASALGQVRDVEVGGPAEAPPTIVLGVGSVYRQGEMAAVRVPLTVPIESGLAEAVPVWVHWEMPNADGDIAEWGRPLTLTKGRETAVWLYAPLPPDVEPGTVWSVRVFEYANERRGRELGGRRFQAAPAGFTSLNTSLLGVVGTPNSMGLGQYKFFPGARGDITVANEDTRIVAGIRPTELCDQWYGLRGFEAIVWSSSDATPADLLDTQAEALAEWVRRGGHLVIVLPEVGNPWGIGEGGKISRSLERLLPATAPDKVEDVPLRDIMPVLAKSEGLDRSVREILVALSFFGNVREGDAARFAPYEPVVVLPDGRVVAGRRSFGHGAVTLIGFDVSIQTLTSVPLSNGSRGAVQADAFWNRILGRRADTPLGSELTAIADDNRLITSTPGERLLASGTLFKDQINMTARAVQGLLLALVLFLLYWIVAGPGSYTILKVQRQLRHAWLAFAGAAALFTALAWGGVLLLGIGGVEHTVRHVTFLDRIARPGTYDPPDDPQYARMTSWLSMYLPGYGATAVGIDQVDRDGRDVPAQRDLLFSWEPPRSRGQRFPNVDRYVVDISKGPAVRAMPTRATATQLYAQHLGPIDEAWGTLFTAEDVRLVVDATGRERLTGRIISDLPLTLTNYTVLWIWNNRTPRRTYQYVDGLEAPFVRQSGALLNNGRMAKGRASEPWEPGGEYELAGIDQPSNTLETNIHGSYVQPLMQTDLPGTGALALRPDEQRKYMEALSIYNMLTPPAYLKAPNERPAEQIVIRRDLARELDLSRWLTRPCLVIIGFLDDVPCPIPLRRGGEPVTSNGRTVVRWIYPLPVEPVVAFGDAFEGDDAAGGP